MEGRFYTISGGFHVNTMIINTAMDPSDYIGRYREPIICIRQSLVPPAVYDAHNGNTTEARWVSVEL